MNAARSIPTDVRRPRNSEKRAPAAQGLKDALSAVSAKDIARAMREKGGGHTARIASESGKGVQQGGE